MGGLQRLLWPDRVAAPLGELPAGVQLGPPAAAAAAVCAQQPLQGCPTRWEASLQPPGVPVRMEGWALDSGRKTGTDHLLASCGLLTPRLTYY